MCGLLFLNYRLKKQERLFRLFYLQASSLQDPVFVDDSWYSQVENCDIIKKRNSFMRCKSWNWSWSVFLVNSLYLLNPISPKKRSTRTGYCWQSRTCWTARPQFLKINMANLITRQLCLFPLTYMLRSIYFRFDRSVVSTFTSPRITRMLMSSRKVLEIWWKFLTRRKNCAHRAMSSLRGSLWTALKRRDAFTCSCSFLGRIIWSNLETWQKPAHIEISRAKYNIAPPDIDFWNSKNKARLCLTQNPASCQPRRIWSISNSTYLTHIKIAMSVGPSIWLLKLSKLVSLNC